MMKSKEYWAHRKAKFIVEEMDKAEDTAKLMKQTYAKAQQYLTEQSEKIFLKYQRDYGLSETQARELLKRSGVDVYKLKRELRNGVQTDEITQLLNDMDSPAYASRIEQLIQSQHDIDNLMLMMAQRDNSLLTQHLKNVSEDSYTNTIDLIKTQIGVNFNANGIDPKTIDNVLGMNWSGKHFSQAIWNNHAELGQMLKEEYLVNLLTGRSNFELSKVIEDKFNVEGYKARRLVRTETTFVMGEIEAKAYEEADIEEYEYVSVLDNRTSTVCQKLDGKTYKVKDRRAGVNYPPMHVFCRATTIAHFSDEWFEDKIVNVDEPIELQEAYRSSQISNKNTATYFVQKNYNNNVNQLDLMAKTQHFNVGNKIRVSAKKVTNSDYDIWVQDRTKRIRDTVFLLEKYLKELSEYKLPKIVVVKQKKIQGLAGYNQHNDVLFISDVLNSEKDIEKMLMGDYFAAENFKDILKHELTHKKHWDSAKSFYKRNKKSYNNLESAMKELNSTLVRYTKQQRFLDATYIEKISRNAENAFSLGNINELIAEIGILGNNIEDKELYKKVMEVLSWK